MLGIGTDLVDVERFARAASRHGAGFLEGLFSPDEIASCSRLRRRSEHLAARFAAREALLKALGTGLVEGMSWRDMEVVPGVAPGVCGMELRGGVGEAARRLGVRRVHLAVATTRAVAMATVVLDG